MSHMVRVVGQRKWNSLFELRTDKERLVLFLGQEHLHLTNRHNTLYMFRMFVW